MFVYREGIDDLEQLKVDVMADLHSMTKKAEKMDKGVYVQASTLGSLEELLDFLTKSNIPFSGINVGPVSKKDVMKAAVMVGKKREKKIFFFSNFL